MYIYICTEAELFFESSMYVYIGNYIYIYIYMEPLKRFSFCVPYFMLTSTSLVPILITELSPFTRWPPPTAFQEIILSKPGITTSFILLLPWERGPGRENFCFQCFTTLWSSVPLTKLPCDRAFSLWTEEPEKLSCPSKTPIVSVQCSRQ